MNSTHNTQDTDLFGGKGPNRHLADQFPEQTLLAKLRKAAEERDTEDHERQRDAHHIAIQELAKMLGWSDQYEAIQAHCEAAKLHEIALNTRHQADRGRAWEATMLAAEIDGSA